MLHHQADGRVYEGEFAQDLKHGLGTMSWPDGYRYKGPWARGVQHGRGVIFDAGGRQDACEFERGQQVFR